MDNPSQYLVHLTSRGPEVSGADGYSGDFKVFMKQPIKDVNKFGLMMYSIPKTLDMITTANNQFTLEFEFENGRPRRNHKTKVGSESDRGGRCDQKEGIEQVRLALHGGWRSYS